MADKLAIGSEVHNYIILPVRSVHPQNIGRSWQKRRAVSVPDDRHSILTKSVGRICERRAPKLGRPRIRQNRSGQRMIGMSGNRTGAADGCPLPGNGGNMKKMDSDIKRMIAGYLALLLITLIAAGWWG